MCTPDDSRHRHLSHVVALITNFSTTSLTPNIRSPTDHLRADSLAEAGQFLSFFSWAWANFQTVRGLRQPTTLPRTRTRPRAHTPAVIFPLRAARSTRPKRRMVFAQWFDNPSKAIDPVTAAAGEGDLAGVFLGYRASTRSP